MGKLKGPPVKGPQESQAPSVLVTIHVWGSLPKAERSSIFIRIIKKRKAYLTSPSFVCCKDSVLRLPVSCEANAPYARVVRPAHAVSVAQATHVWLGVLLCLSLLSKPT